MPSKIFPEKGHGLTSAEWQELGRLCLKLGKVVRIGKEAKGSYIEFYRQVDFGIEKAAPRDESTESGGAEKNNPSEIISPKGDEVNANS